MNKLQEWKGFLKDSGMDQNHAFLRCLAKLSVKSATRIWNKAYSNIGGLSLWYTFLQHFSLISCNYLISKLIRYFVTCKLV